MVHHHEHQEQAAQERQICEICEKQSKNFRHSAYLIGAFVLIGTVLVSASIFYNTKIVLKRLDAGATVATADQQNDNAAQPQGQAPSNPIDFALRNGSAVLGQNSAKVTMVMFSDFQCPYCAKFFNDSFSKIKSSYIDTGKIRFVYQNFPLPMHANAQKAAEAGECANRQGKFEPYMETLFTKSQGDGTGLAVGDLKKYATNLGLDTAAFNKCLDSGETATAVKQDADEGSKMGVSGTPSFLIFKNNNLTFDVGYIQNKLQANQSMINLPNGNVFAVGAQPFAAFQQALDAMLK